MLSDYVKSSNIIELISEETSEDGVTHKALIRVGNFEFWHKLIVELLNVPDEDSEYGISIRKEFFLGEEGAPTFVWVLLLWGVLEEAAAEIGPVLSVSTTEISTPQKINGSQQTQRNEGRVVVVNDGMRTVTRIPLPHRRGRRDDPGVTKTLGSRKLGAFVSTISER